MQRRLHLPVGESAFGKHRAEGASEGQWVPAGCGCRGRGLCVLRRVHGIGSLGLHEIGQGEWRVSEEQEMLGDWPGASKGP